MILHQFQEIQQNRKVISHTIHFWGNIAQTNPENILHMIPLWEPLIKSLMEPMLWGGDFKCALKIIRVCAFNIHFVYPPSKEQEKAAEKLLANGSNTPITLGAIGGQGPGDPQKMTDAFVPTIRLAWRVLTMYQTVGLTQSPAGPISLMHGVFEKSFS